ncbi:MAG: hypothetical protein JOZ57_13020, partial [Abitibacteriaceae bacterium]|nr:hypothetical protein [Abditibacteriaceae bacterium]
MLRKFLLMAAVVSGTSWLCQADTVTLKVVGSDGQPLAGAEVFVNVGKENPTLKTDAAGSVTWDLDAPKAGSNSYGRATAYVPGLALGSTSLNKGENTVHLGQPSQLQGTITDPQGQPVAGAKVKINYLFSRTIKKGQNSNYVWLPEALKERFTARTDAQGNWIIKDLPSGATVNVVLDDPQYVRTNAQGTVKASGLTLEPLIARRGATVTGRVVYE